VKLGFEESQAVYDSGSQNARALTEHWLHATAFCPSCGHSQLTRFPNNSPVADFACPECGEQFELKSQKMSFGAKILDGAQIYF
jgi:type II restriction enzyme